jgi:hypothetical protein
MVIECHARRRAAPRIQHPGQPVGVVAGPARPTAAPTELGAGRDVVQRSRLIPGSSQIGFRVAVVGEQIAFAVECQIVRVPQPAGQHLYSLAVDVQTQDRTAGGLNTDVVLPGDFEPRTDQCAFVVVPVRAAIFGLLGHLGVVAEHDIDGAVAAERQTVRPRLARSGGELEQRPDLVHASVAVLVQQPVQSASVRPLARHKHVAVQTKNSVAIRDQIGVDPDLVRPLIPVAVVDQQQLAAFARRDHVPELVERHRDQRTGRLAVQQGFHVKFRWRTERADCRKLGRRFCNLLAHRRRRVFVLNQSAAIGRTRGAAANRRDRCDIVPRRRRSQRTENLCGFPPRVVVQRRVPERQRAQAGNPRIVCRELVRATRLVLNLDACGQRRRGSVGVLDPDRHQIAAPRQEPRDVVPRQLASGSPRADAAAVDKQLVSVVGRDLDDALPHRRHLKRLAEMARCLRHSQTRMVRRPDPLSRFVGKAGRRQACQSCQQDRSEAAQQWSWLPAVTVHTHGRPFCRGETQRQPARRTSRPKPD